MLLAAALLLSPFAAGAAPAVADAPYTIARTQVTTLAAPDGHPYRLFVACLAQRSARSRYVELSGQGHGTTMLAAMGEVIALAFGAERPR